ncbi:hypothetical protein LOTGIDRAFT_234304 [Lottia gigantea]|uniref:Uncharacterized protein n=1 Tax=Lottia gigantea TaxID=225164 RepID=V4A859_LOTGI|nr:hypothetical protein LOTGIDRAFT_234304 [Lottia gigantea]ESO89461.1 hypothetical protein LOTGIDRAFT_234304 [Lottia gigantea]
MRDLSMPSKSAYEYEDGRVYKVHGVGGHSSGSSAYSYSSHSSQRYQPEVVYHSNPAYPPHTYSTKPYVVINQPVNRDAVIQFRPNDYFPFSLFTCLCCFCPTGLVALYYSWKSRKASRRLDFNLALEDGKCAKTLGIVSLVIGIILIIMGIILLIVFYAFGFNKQ